MEHQQMRNLLARMYEAVSNGDPEEILEVGETMMILMQQHNVKEEGILYLMADQYLDLYWEELIERMDAVAIPVWKPNLKLLTLNGLPSIAA